MNIELNLQPIEIEERWKDNGAFGVLSHFDDETIFWGLLNKFKQSGVNTTIAYLTGGELGRPSHVGEISSDQVKINRLEEMQQISSILGISFIPLDLGDMRISPDRYLEIIHIVMDCMRAANPGVAFGFDEFDNMLRIRHQDHNAAGMYLTHAANGADVHGYPYSSLRPMKMRPDLLNRTTRLLDSTHYIQYSQQDLEDQAEYFLNFKTQTTQEDLPAIKKIFKKVSEVHAGVLPSNGIIYEKDASFPGNASFAELYRRTR